MSLSEVFIIKEEDAEQRAKHQDALDKTGFWGKQAAGCLFYARDTGRLMISHRSEKVLEPHTWGTWGGAIDDGEDPAEAVKREIREEAGVVGEVEMIPVWTFKHASGFRYHNFIAIVDHEFEPKLDPETQGFEWVEPGQWPSPLHPGLATLISRPEFKSALERLG